MKMTIYNARTLIAAPPGRWATVDLSRGDRRMSTGDATLLNDYTGVNAPSLVIKHELNARRLLHGLTRVTNGTPIPTPTAVIVGLVRLIGP